MKRYIMALLVSLPCLGNIDKLQEDVANKRHAIREAKLQYYIAKRTLELENMKNGKDLSGSWQFWKSRSFQKASYALAGAALVIAIKKI